MIQSTNSIIFDGLIFKQDWMLLCNKILENALTTYTKKSVDSKSGIFRFKKNVPS